MSDLLPLVLAGIRDKTLSDAQDELERLRNQLDAATRVEIIRATIYENRGGDDREVCDRSEEAVVYASGRFVEDGKYRDQNENFWAVGFPTKGPKVCRLSDLEHCDICVGGGIPCMTLNQRQTRQLTMGFLRKAWDNSARIVLPLDSDGTNIELIIHGLPRIEWSCETFPLRYYTELVAPRYPNATVEFVRVAFWTSGIHGAFKRLLPAKRIEEAEAERAKLERETEDEEAAEAERAKLENEADELEAERVRFANTDKDDYSDDETLWEHRKPPAKPPADGAPPKKKLKQSTICGFFSKHK